MKYSDDGSEGVNKFCFKPTTIKKIASDPLPHNSPKNTYSTDFSHFVKCVSRYPVIKRCFELSGARIYIQFVGIKRNEIIFSYTLLDLLSSEFRQRPFK